MLKVSCLQKTQEKGRNIRTSQFYFYFFAEKPVEEEKSSSSPSSPAEQRLLTSKPQEKQEAAAVEAPKDVKRDSRRWETIISFDCGLAGANGCFSFSI